MIRPGPMAILGLGLCLVPALAMALWPGLGPWLVLAFMAWLAITLGSVARLPRSEHLLLEVSQRGTARIGQQLSLQLTLSNLHFQRLHVDAALVHRAPTHAERARLRLSLAPGEQAERAVVLTPTRRGILDCGVLRASLRGSLRWVERVVELPLDTKLQVHPATPSTELLSALYPDALPDRPQPTPERIAFAGLRAFVSGDDARDLSWTASARSGAPMVRTWEGPRDGPVLLLLDRGAGMSVAMDDGSSRLDRAVAVATGLLRSFRRSGRPVAVGAWSSDLDLWQRPAGRPAIRALAALQPAEHPWDPTRLGARLVPMLAPMCTVVIITEPDGEPEALARSLASLRPHAAVRVLLIGEAALRRAVRAPVRTLDGAYDFGAALALTAQRRDAVARWRAAGARVVDAGGRRERLSPDPSSATRWPGTPAGPSPDTARARS